jgi:hypothetical protein
MGTCWDHGHQHRVPQASGGGDVVADATNSGPRAKSANGREIREEPSLAHEVAVKYRDPATGNTWRSGRKARWLKVKQDAGEDIPNYLVKPEQAARLDC